MATQAEMIMKCRRKLYEMNSGRFADSMFRDWINEACDDAARRTQCLRENASIVAVNGTQTYAAPVNLLSLHSVRYQATGSNRTTELEYQDYKNAASVGWGSLTSALGTPETYWTWSFPPTLEIHVYPTPAQGGTLLLHYYKTFDQLAVEDDTDADTVLPFPPGWDDMLADYVIAEGLLSDRDLRHSTYRDRYEARLGGFADTTVRFSDQAGSVAVGNGYLPEWVWNSEWDG